MVVATDRMLRRFSLEGRLDHVAGTGSCDGDPAPLASVDDVTGFAIDVDHIVCVAEVGGHCVRQVLRPRRRGPYHRGPNRLHRVRDCCVRVAVTGVQQRHRVDTWDLDACSC